MKTKLKILALFLFLNSCTEPFDIKDIEFTDALVVNAVITDELKTQKVILTRTQKLNDNFIIYEESADVSIVSTDNIYNFIESDPGYYNSEVPFKAEKNKTYKLIIKTKNGNEYNSDEVKLLGKSSIETIEASLIDIDGIEFISINGFGRDLDNSTNFYRFDYEETFNIIPPFWTQLEGYIISDTPPFQVGLRFREKEERVCYKTKTFNGILVTETNNQTENKIVNFPIKILDRNEFYTPTRYSILVKQYTQSRGANNYYKLLNKFSSSTDSPFTQVQAGPIPNNLKCINNNKELILGYFEISSYDEKRIFLNYSDFFTKGRPETLEDCEIIAPLLVGEGRADSSPLINLMKNNKYKVIDENLSSNPELKGPFLVTEAKCTDCTQIGSNIKPSFWID